ncbi:hypothetical protein QBC35DRAFT_147113 [Podospora australis]|uniref:CorA-like transporter domain-containing protein n=1 Tax=Podospora australis TaxID=1536484 RepID=A0AAN7ABM8_9PEZI|nr:hypothetical protein QBC35DRAFT_147113 [Podospora australis]
MSITVNMFHRVYKSHGIMPHFLKTLKGFGRKISSKDQDFMAAYSHLSNGNLPTRRRVSSGDAMFLAENEAESLHLVSNLCYNVRHFELHGRPQLEDPWSCRQSAIHHSFKFQDQNSHWVIVQPPALLDSAVKRSNLTNNAHPMSLHIQYLAASTDSWRAYLAYIEAKLIELDNEISIHRPYAEFGLDFKSKQRIHHLRGKLLNALSILRNTTSILAAITAHECRVADMCEISELSRKDFGCELANIGGEVHNHIQTCEKLLGRSSDIRLMYDDILKLGGQELLQENGRKLTQIAESSMAESQTMNSIAHKTFQDARTTRIVTVVAMIYLPVNLVISFFSTTLVWFEDDVTMRVHKESWIIVVATLVLTACTLMVYMLLTRRSKSFFARLSL